MGVVNIRHFEFLHFGKTNVGRRLDTYFFKGNRKMKSNSAWVLYAAVVHQRQNKSQILT